MRSDGSVGVDRIGVALEHKLDEIDPALLLLSVDRRGKFRLEVSSRQDQHTLRSQFADPLVFLPY